MSHLLYRMKMTLFKPRCVSISLLHVLSTQALGSRILCSSERKYDLHSNTATNATNDKARQQELWTLTQSIYSNNSDSRTKAQQTDVAKTSSSTRTTSSSTSVFFSFSSFLSSAVDWGGFGGLALVQSH